GSLFEDLGEVLADSVVRHPTGDLDAGLRHVGELVRVVGMRPDRVGEVLSDLVLRDVERCRELDVRDVVAAQVDVHEAGHELLGICVLVVLDSLQKGVGAVPYADDCHAHLAVSARAAVLGAVARGHRFLSVVAEPFREGLDDELVDRPLALAGAPRELFLQLERHAQEDVALLARTAALAAGALEGDGETGSEDADRKVVEVAPGRFDLAGEVALEVRGHADEDVLAFPCHHLVIAQMCYQPLRSCLRTKRIRCTTVTHAVVARRAIVAGRTRSLTGASTSPAVMTTTRSARLPSP